MSKEPFNTKGRTPGDEVGSRYARVSGFRTTKVDEAISRKLVEGTFASGQTTLAQLHRDKDGAITPPNALVSHVANQTASNVVDNENMMQLLPDMQLAKQVLVASILSPVDMISTELTYNSTADAFGDVKTALLDVVKDYFEEDYKITTKLPGWLEEALFDKGAKPLAVLPESSIDWAINSNSRVTMENLRDQLSPNGTPLSYGLLGNSDVVYNDNGRTRLNTTANHGFGLESLQDTLAQYDPAIKISRVVNKEGGLESFDLGVYVTDNVQVLKFPRLHEKMVEDRIQDALGKHGVGMEASRARMEKENDNASIYQPRSFQYRPIIKIRTLDELERATVGHPLVTEPPVESVIPIHVPSAPNQHIGYFMVVDRHGNPVRAMSSQDYYADLAYNASNLREMSSQLLSQARRASEGRKELNDIQMFDEGTQVYTEIVEADLISRLKNGIMGDNFQIARPTEIYRMMFARAAAKMQTQLVYIPASLMTYIAFDYNHLGVGKSLLEATKILGSIRAMMLFSNTMAGIKNSVNHVGLNIELDATDPDPDATVEILLHEYAKTRQAAYPIGMSNPLDIISYLQNAGVEVATSGHPKYPDTKVTLENRNTNFQKVDTELDDNLKKRHLMACGMAPETVELSMGVDFATSIVNSNILLAKRAIVYQQVFTEFVAAHIKTFTRNSATLMEKLRKVIEGNKDKFKLRQGSKLDTDKIVLYFIDSVEVSLPSPDLKKLETQMTAFDGYSAALDKALAAFISSDMFDNSQMGDLSNAIGPTLNILKASFQRRWLEENGVMTELFDLVTTEDNKKGSYDLLRQHEVYMESLGESIVAFMKRAAAFAQKGTKASQDITTQYGTSAPEGGGESTASEGGGEEGGEAGGGTDDGGFDLGGAEEAAGGEGGEAGGGGEAGASEEAGGDGGFDLAGAEEAAGGEGGNAAPATNATSEEVKKTETEAVDDGGFNDKDAEDAANKAAGA